MKIALYSDLHLELGSWQPHTLNVDVVILAGDVASHTHGLAWATRMLCQESSSPSVLYVAGNHEYYDAHLGMLDQLRQPKWEQMGVLFMEKRVIEIGGVRFLGCTLWSAFDLHGADKVEAYMAIAKRSINDYRMIQTHGGRRLEPRDTLALHRKAVHWLDTELAKPFDGRTVVITHFAPHRRCVEPRYEGSDLSPYFVTDLSRLMAKHQIAVWCYGHTHGNADFEAENGCRVISNQLGYPSERLRADTGFRPDLVIEL